MNNIRGRELSEDAKAALEALQQAVDAALEKKRKLGQYAVIWDGEKAVRITGESLTSEE